MNLTSAEIYQYIAWFLTLVEFVLALYVLLLNTRHIANRHVSGMLLLFALNSLSFGAIFTATTIGEATWSSYGIAATTTATAPTLLVVSVVLLKPEWLQGRWRRAWWPAYLLIFLSAILLIIDVLAGTSLWYTGIDPDTYSGGYVSWTTYTLGSLSTLLRVLNLYLAGLAPLFIILYVLIFDRQASRANRRLVWLLLATQAITLFIQFGIRSILGPIAATFTVNLTLVIGYAYATFQQMISERRAQRGRLQTRLTALILVVAVPVLVAVVVFSTLQTGKVLEQKADEQLEATNRALAANVSVWLDLNIQALNQLVNLPDIVSMDAARQKPLLETMAAAHPHMYLVSTTDMSGFNVARNDAKDPKDYHDRLWYLEASKGAPLTFQTLVGRTSGEPALVASMPIRAESGDIVGVGMFASDLDSISQEVRASIIGETGVAYVVDDLNQVVAHPVAEYAAELLNLGEYPTVRALREGTQGALTFTDEEGVTWRAYVDELDNGWGVIVQQQEQELFSTIRNLQQISWIVVVIGSLILAGLMALTIRQVIRPIGILTETATAIAGGDLDREAPVESEDEIGALAQAFNSMTQQLRSLIGSLERQVEERTAELAQRSRYLEATADVSRAVASILDPEQMARQMVELIRERFGLYYVGLFLVDPAKEWAVLRAGTGRAGQAMLARGHRIRVEEGMIGWSVARGQSRVASEVGEDAVRLATEELPDTRSEAALPLRSRGQMLGALTIQHTEPGAFGPDTLAVLQTMADQVAVALDNAQLFAQSQTALEAERRAYGEMGRQAWTGLLRARRGQGYRYAQRAVTTAGGEWRAEILRALQTGQVIQSDGGEGATLAVPIKLRDQVLGVLRLNKGTGDETWSRDEITLLEELSLQLGVALESARLYQDTQRSAARERLISEVAARIRETLDVETVLRTAAQEVRQALGLPEVVVRLRSPAPPAPAPPTDGARGDGQKDEP